MKEPTMRRRRGRPTATKKMTKTQACETTTTVTTLTCFRSISHGYPKEDIHMKETLSRQPKSSGGLQREQEEARRHATALKNVILNSCPLLSLTNGLSFERTVIKTSKVPNVWRQIRGVLIDKDDGGKRALTITCCMWRLGLSAIGVKLDAWVKQWMHPEVLLLMQTSALVNSI